MQENLDEHALVKQVLSGDRQAILLLVRQYERLVLHILNPIIIVREDREDLSQDVFIKVIDKLHTFRFQSRLGTWIGHIAYHTALNFLKKKKSIPLSALDPGHELSMLSIAGDLDSVEELMIKAEEIDYLMTCIDQLPIWQKTTLILFYQDELSLEEISTILTIPVNTVKSHLFRAKANLKQRMLNQKHT